MTVSDRPGFLNDPRLRPADVLGLLVIFVLVAWWVYLYANPGPPPASQQRAPQPSVVAPEGTLSPMTAPGSEPVEVSLP